PRCPAAGRAPGSAGSSRESAPSAEPRDRQSARHLLHLVGNERARSTQRLVHRRHHQILEHRAVGILEHRGIDLDAEHLHASVHHRGPHPTASTPLGRAGCDLILHRRETFLQLLGLLQQAPQIEALAHVLSFVHERRSRTPRTSAPKISTAAWTRGSASVSSSRRPPSPPPSSPPPPPPPAPTPPPTA